VWPKPAESSGPTPAAPPIHRILATTGAHQRQTPRHAVRAPGAHGGPDPTDTAGRAPGTLLTRVAPEDPAFGPSLPAVLAALDAAPSSAHGPLAPLALSPSPRETAGSPNSQTALTAHTGVPPVNRTRDYAAACWIANSSNSIGVE